MNVLLTLGSNLDNPIAQVQKAVAALQQESDIEVLEQASLYSSSPRGPQDQDDYVNSAVLIDTPLNAIDLLKL
ncbi:2-amino-4-hydroxy-6-hydroxymethyldihydropteridine diphosphokinase, partial [Oleiphilus sp. HI0067]